MSSPACARRWVCRQQRRERKRRDPVALLLRRSRFQQRHIGVGGLHPVIARTTVSSSSLPNEASPAWISAGVSPMTAVASAGVPIREKLAA